ncbi:MAG: N-acetylmuramoyl-L-alanine amidase [Lachnospiraceae bacterium]|nr:N-acetylmuramoyl-L-alanine amidase [Lachnospiraceae bacterium]
MATRVVIDPGHGGFDNGAVYNGRREKDDNLKIALALGQILQNNGVEVSYTRTDDRYDSPIQKARIANASGADYLVSIHRNAAYAPNTYEGVQTLVFDNSGMRKVLAEAINSELEEIGFNNIGVETRRDLAVLRRSTMPAVLVEVGFIDNDYDNTVLDTDVNRTAQAIADGILKATGAMPATSSNVSAPAMATGTSGGNSRTPVRSIVDDIFDDDNDDDDDREYKLQVGLFRVFRYAKNLQRELSSMGFDTELEKEGEFFVVFVEGFRTLDDAIKAEAELKRRGYDNFIVQD